MSAVEEFDPKIASKRPATDAEEDNKRQRKRRKSKSNTKSSDSDTYKGNTKSSQSNSKSPKRNSDTQKNPNPNKKRKRTSKPLNGMVVAVSTLDVKGQSHSDSQSSYKAVADQCQKLGASVTGQLHRRVSCLVCNETAVKNSTQRVRKAVKKKVPLVDVAWIHKCRDEEELVDMDPFRLDDLATTVVESRKEKASTVEVEVTDASAEVDGVPASAWTEPESLGCCCVCHENGDDNCPWCPDCNAKR